MKRRGFLHAALAAAVAAPLFSPADAEAARTKKKAPPRRRAARKPVEPAGEPGKATVQVPGPAARSPVDLAEEVAPRSPWREYVLQASLRLPAQSSDVQLWLPSPWIGAPAWQQVLETAWEGAPTRTRIARIGTSEHLVAEWPAGKEATLDVRWLLQTRDRRFDLTRGNQPADAPAALRDALQLAAAAEGEPDPRKIAGEIIGRLRDPVAQAHRLYEWLVDHARYVPGNGEATSQRVIEQLARQEVAGNDETINAAFVVLARAGGIPARLAWGLRVDQSAITQSLGKTPAGDPVRHVRAEFYAHSYGWIPVDPADVCRAALLDRDALDGRRAQVLRKLLFGFWEMNWICLGMPPLAVQGDPTDRAAQPKLLRADGQPLPLHALKITAGAVATS